MKKEWKEYSLEDLLSYEQPTPYIVESTEYDDSFETPVLTAGSSFILGYTDETDGIYNQVPVIIFDDFTTASKYVNFPFKVKSSAMKILTANKELVLPKFIYYRMQTINFEHSTHKRYWIQQYSKIKVEIPSLSEQKRIVNKIEELFSELDSAVETLKKTKEQLAVYRQSVLKETLKKYETLKKVPVTELVVDEKYALAIGPFGSNLKVSDYTNNGVRLVFVKDIRNSFSSETTKYISEAKATELTPHCVYQGDLLITKMGDPPGDCCIYPYADRGVITSDCIRIKVDETKMDKMCLLLYIHSAYGKEQIKGMTQGVAQKKISLERFKKFEVPRIDILEQKELVKNIQSRMSVCENIEKTVNDALIQADAMRQSILKKAFEGSL